MTSVSDLPSERRVLIARRASSVFRTHHLSLHYIILNAIEDKYHVLLGDLVYF